jgi:hypothetical protein
MFPLATAHASAVAPLVSRMLTPPSPPCCTRPHTHTPLSPPHRASPLPLGCVESQPHHGLSTHLEQPLDGLALAAPSGDVQRCGADSCVQRREAAPLLLRSLCRGTHQRSNVAARRRQCCRRCHRRAGATVDLGRPSGARARPVQRAFWRVLWPAPAAGVLQSRHLTEDRSSQRRHHIPHVTFDTCQHSRSSYE